MKKTLYFGLLAMVILISGCNGPAARQNNVNIESFAYNPATITVQKGTTVTWTQIGSVIHTVTGDGFDSGNLNKGQTFSWKFNETGTFVYKCFNHPGMSGEVIVK